MSRAGRHIRVAGKRRDVIDTDRLAALLLRVALRRIADDDTDQATAGPAAPDSDTDDVEGEAAT